MRPQVLKERYGSAGMTTTAWGHAVPAWDGAGACLRVRVSMSLSVSLGPSLALGCTHSTTLLF